MIPQPTAAEAAGNPPSAESAAAKDEKHFAVPLRDKPGDSLIAKPLPSLEAAAKVVLNEQDYELFAAHMARRAALEKERNDLAHGCYGVAAITSMTVQNTQSVEAVHNTPSAELREQLEVLAKDCDIAAVKIGMIGNRGNAVVVGEFLDAHKFALVVHDPVMKSSTGTELLDAGGVKYVTTELLKRSSVITPNVPEAEILTGMEIKDVAAMEAAARKIVELGAKAVIVKGGHMERAVDVIFDGNELVQLGGDRVKTDQTHGTGCTFASALAAQLAAGRGLVEAATLAKAYVTKAIEKSYAVGKGRIPLDHFYRLKIEPLARGTHELPNHGMHPPAEPAAH